MKKAEIYEAYNNLTPVLQSKIDQYKAQTGEYYRGINTAGKWTPSVMMDYKDNLENRLIHRENFIKEIEEATRKAMANMSFLSTEVGVNFLAHLNEKGAELEGMISARKRELVERFNELLNVIGLGEWEMAGDDFKYSTTVWMKSNHKVNITVRISCKDGKYYLEPSSSILCGYVGADAMYAGNTSSQQYLQFKACCLIVEHGDSVNEFFHDYRSINREIDILEDNLTTVEGWIADPVEAASTDRTISETAEYKNAVAYAK